MGVKNYNPFLARSYHACRAVAKSPLLVASNYSPKSGLHTSPALPRSTAKVRHRMGSSFVIWVL